MGGALGAYAPPRSCERSGHAKRALLVARRVSILIACLVQQHCLASLRALVVVRLLSISKSSSGCRSLTWDVLRKKGNEQLPPCS